VLTIRKADERGRTKTNWLDSRHTFSFGDYRDASFVQFGALRVINEDRIVGGSGFQPHAHNDMEILTYVLDGTLKHHDSSGGEGLIRACEIQRMTAGSGVVHSEVNAHPRALCHFLQIWIEPSQTGLEPSYEQRILDREAMKNRFARIAAPDPIADEVRIIQDVELWGALLETDNEAIRSIAPGRRAWLQVARGRIVLNDAELTDGDGVAITDEDGLLVRATAPSELLLFDLA
jgi:quercetin 2,3-dioxygenase